MYDLKDIPCLKRLNQRQAVFAKKDNTIEYGWNMECLKVTNYESKDIPCLKRLNQRQAVFAKKDNTIEYGWNMECLLVMNNKLI